MIAKHTEKNYDFIHIGVLQATSLLVYEHGLVQYIKKLYAATGANGLHANHMVLHTVSSENKIACCGQLFSPVNGSTEVEDTSVAQNTPPLRLSTSSTHDSGGFDTLTMNEEKP